MSPPPTPRKGSRPERVVRNLPFADLAVQPSSSGSAWTVVTQGSEDGRVQDRLSLRLEPMDRHNWRAALAVRVTPDQLPYVAGHQPVALVILAKAYVRPGNLAWEPLAVTAEASVVAVVALAHAGTHTEMLHLAVDVAQQGQGVGSAAVDLLVAHIRRTRPQAVAVRLTVHPENVRAQRLYRGRHFVPTGDMRDGEPVWSLNLRQT